MIEKWSKDELLINDDFIRYCTRPTAADKEQWAHYLHTYPDQWERLEEAKTIILALFEVLREEELGHELDRLKQAISSSWTNENTSETQVMGNADRRGFKWWYAAAALIPIAIFIYFYQSNWNGRPEQRLAGGETIRKSGPPVIAANSNMRTVVGEKKTIQLPDGSRVVLNGNSSIIVAHGFGTVNRSIQLTGEAFFDVQHNEQIPFVVQVEEYSVKVHGTSFNVRAYKGEKCTETALLRGSVEIILNNAGDSSIFLEPNQKAVLKRTVESVLPTRQAQSGILENPTIQVVPLTISGDGNSIIETIWTRNSLEINDESFEQLKEKFERWFRVSIQFGDDQIKAFRFTANFENIPLEQALEAMQLSNPFNYELNGNQLVVKTK